MFAICGGYIHYGKWPEFMLHISGAIEQPVSFHRVYNGCLTFLDDEENIILININLN